jgi:hypothetical protein
VAECDAANADIPAIPGGGTERLAMMSPSAADDGGFVAMADVATAAGLAGMGDDYRLIGGIAVMLHVQRLGIDVPLRPGAPQVVMSKSAVVEVAGAEKLPVRAVWAVRGL